MTSASYDTAPAGGATALPYPAAESRSAALYNRARAVLPSGNSRATVFFKPYPLYAVSGAGCMVTDADGVARIDFLNNYTSLIHGHGHPAVLAAARAQIETITAVGLPTESEIDLAELLVDRLAGVDQVRFANSGTEAVMMAIKAARAYTGRPAIAKVEGAYHGAYDFAEVSQISLPTNWGAADHPASARAYHGQPQSVLDEVVVLPWNDVAASRALLEANAARLAGVLIDPMPSRVALSKIDPDYLDMLRSFTAKSGALFILDEVFNLRMGYRGAQGELGFQPDITAMGKIIGGGFPVGAIGGKAAVMSVFNFDEGRPRISHGGTYNANPVTMAAGRAAMETMTPEAFARLAVLGESLRDGLRAALHDANVPGQVSGDASLAMLSLNETPIRTYRDLVGAARHGERQVAIQQRLLNRGILTSPALMFALSTAMGEAEIDHVVAEIRGTLREG